MLDSTQTIYPIPVSNQRSQITIKPDEGSTAEIRLKQSCVGVYTKGYMNMCSTGEMNR